MEITKEIFEGLEGFIILIFLTYYLFIPDFYCHEKRLIIELDGSIHDLQVEYDQLREGHLQEMGYRVIRFRNEEILKAWEQSALRLEEYIDSL